MLVCWLEDIVLVWVAKGKKIRRKKSTQKEYSLAPKRGMS